jgi:hypothetical protein
MCFCTVLGSCSSSASQVPSEWPPPDFRLVVEETASGSGHGQTLSTKRFVVEADGTCFLGKSTTPLVDATSTTVLPVFDTMCAYRLRPECTRLLARKLEQRGVRALDPLQGTGSEVAGRSIRIVHHAFGHETRIQASGQIHGGFVRVLHIVNAYLPSSESFSLPGMTGDAEPENLAGVPAPIIGAVGALAWHEELLRQQGEQPELLLDTFALACRVGDRARSEALLARWAAASELPATPDAPFYEAPRLLPEVLRRLLPQ